MGTLFIISGHGFFATGMKSTIELIAGKQDNVYYVDFTVDDNDTTLKEKIVNIIEESKCKQTLLICDLLGGTPFKVMAEIANDKDNMEVVVGCNVGSIIEGILTMGDLSIREVAEQLVNTSKNSTLRFEKIAAEESIECDLYEDGI